MKQRKFFLLTAICVALTLVLGACGDDIKAEAEKNGLILSDDGKTVTGVKDKAMTDCIIPDGVTECVNFAVDFFKEKVVEECIT